MRTHVLTFFYLIFCLFHVSCNWEDKTIIPKPKGYLKTSFPVHSYQKYVEQECPYTFLYSTSAILNKDSSGKAEPCWINIIYPAIKATIYLSYKPINNNLNTYTEDARSFVVKHQIKASSITENIIKKDSSKVFGLVYDIRGNAASSVQFYLTDSSKNFLRGALYFNAKTNVDSLNPYIDFVSKDIEKFIDSFSWR